MSAQITPHHLQRPAYVYVRQSTMGQVRHHQESTERQYALREKAIALGWAETAIRILDGDLGQSGAHSAQREDFKTLVAEVSMDHVGAVLALEVSRLARSNADWQRLLELCALTRTLVIDEDGCYDPGDFNDGLLLGLKGTMAQAELHFLRARLLGGKRNKAAKGELHSPLPVGLVYVDGQIVLDPDAEVRSAIALVFRLFRDTGSAYGVVQHFAKAGLTFPKRAYGGAWDGRLLWGRLSHERVLGILRNPAYAGAYVYGRYQYQRCLGPDGSVQTKTSVVPMAEWQVNLPDHHPGYIDWVTYLDNQARLASNCTLSETTLLSGPAREGLALLQGLLVCAHCGRRVTVRDQGQGGVAPVYLCNWKRHEGLDTRDCLSVRCDLLDTVVAERVLAALQPAELELALRALDELEGREAAQRQHWQLRLQRADYEAQLAERRYAEVDPANRLVAATLEQRWNEALQRLAELQQHSEQANQSRSLVLSARQRAQVLALAEDVPTLWSAPTTTAKDRKRLLRLLIKDVTVERAAPKQLRLHMRWQGGALSEVAVSLPLSRPDQVRYPPATVERIKTLAATLDDAQIAAQLNQEGQTSPTGKAFTFAMIRWVRYKHAIPSPPPEDADGLSVEQMMIKFDVSCHVVYYWIERGHVSACQRKPGTPYRIHLESGDEQRLADWVASSSRLSVQRHPEPAL
ncbi:recombinase family protein [uncultured Thiodictyon sp.]|jgi:DNA invertase Pin-like site-specific DNA recombinase|uniref:recombinase family protein n=1 Tax=uncultured Thiodictyon sp. TaxID=1846217 RepID=UPI0025D01FA9|nr:recombinase family protein [uncultured Thiodictyon sp.]